MVRIHIDASKYLIAIPKESYSSMIPSTEKLREKKLLFACAHGNVDIA